MGGHRYAHSGLWGCCRPERQGPAVAPSDRSRAVLTSLHRHEEAALWADPAGAVTSLAAVGSAGAASSGPGRDGSRTPLSGTFPCLGPRQASGARAVTRPEASSWALWGRSRAVGCDRKRRPIVTGISRACGNVRRVNGSRALLAARELRPRGEGEAGTAGGGSPASSAPHGPSLEPARLGSRFSSGRRGLGRGRRRRVCRGRSVSASSAEPACGPFPF